MLTLNALTAADRVIIPVQSHYLPVKGLEQLLRTVSKVQRQLNSNLKISGILITMTESRTNFSKEISQLVRNAYGKAIRVYNTEIPRGIKAAEMSARGASIFSFDPRSPVATAYKDGSLGTLSAPSIGLSTKIYQGTDSAAMRKGAGHFTETSIWDGNVAFAGHNRGVNNHFGKIHTLKNGDTITLATTLGTRRYSVYSVRKVSVNDVSVLNPSDENMVTLVTCVMNQPDYRWCVQARQK